MPNWCMTDYRIEGSKRTLKRINDTIQSFLKGESEPMENSCRDWEGNVLLTLKCIKDWKKHYVRGFIQEAYIENDVLCIVAEEAWSRTEFAELLEKHFPSLSVYWSAEECGCEIFQTNDSSGKYFDYRFYVDACVDGEYSSEYFKTKQEALKWIADISECKSEESIKEFNSNNEDDYIYLFEFEVV